MLEHLPFLLVGGILLIGFFGLGLTGYKTKLPPVLIYIIFGLLLRGIFIDQAEVLSHAAEIGIVLLFFLLGLEFPLNKMMDISKRVWAAGILDIILNLGIGSILALLFGMGWVEALILGAVAYASSSSITIKLLEDKKRLAAPESEFILALLIFEDLVAPVLVSLLASIYLGVAISSQGLGLLLFKTVVLILGAVVIGYYGFSKIGNFIEQHHETDFMPLFAVGIALAYAGVAIVLGLSEVLGAFLAGVMLSETGQSQELDHIILPIRNLFLPFFFFWFGTTISLEAGVPMVPLLLILTLWSIAGKILTGFFGGRLFGLTPASSLRSGFSLVQRGEFSVIIAAVASVQIRAFSGVYIVLTAFIGMFFFANASQWSKRLIGRFAVAKGQVVENK
jgi:CPA2 family monovalent cation:H+ antiporter-2